MAVTSTQITEQERYLNQIDRIAHSNTLRKAESLCRLLRYLAEHALHHPNVPLKEYQIATEVFGRPRDFDPQTDSAIRVQAGRLRLKLLDYYNHEGANDPVMVEMPNGVYGLNFHYREPVAPLPAATPFPLPFERPAARSSDRKWIIAVSLLAAALTIALIVIAVMSFASKPDARTSLNRVAAPPALGSFWGQFVTSPEAPWVIFSNADFVGRPETGMRYLDPARDSRDHILDHYTGVGEVLAVHELDKMFDLLNRPIEVKRGSLFTLDDAKKTDLIFVGSPAENLTLLDLPGSQEFVFKRLDSSPHKGGLGIVITHPQGSEPAIFYPSASSQPLTEDFAIIALLRGLDPSRHVIILAGTTTIGTQAAVEYVCGNGTVEELLRRLAIPTGGEVKPFEALLRVKVTRGVPVGVQLVAVRGRN